MWKYPNHTFPIGHVEVIEEEALEFGGTIGQKDRRFGAQNSR